MSNISHSSNALKERVKDWLHFCSFSFIRWSIYIIIFFPLGGVWSFWKLLRWIPWGCTQHFVSMYIYCVHFVTNAHVILHECCKATEMYSISEGTACKTTYTFSLGKGQGARFFLSLGYPCPIVPQFGDCGAQYWRVNLWKNVEIANFSGEPCPNHPRKLNTCSISSRD